MYGTNNFASFNLWAIVNLLLRHFAIFFHNWFRGRLFRFLNYREIWPKRIEDFESSGGTKEGGLKIQERGSNHKWSYELLMATKFKNFGRSNFVLSKSPHHFQVFIKLNSSISYSQVYNLFNSSTSYSNYITISAPLYLSSSMQLF